MSKYHNFIGIDIGKFTFVIAINNSKETKEYEMRKGATVSWVSLLEFRKTFGKDPLELEDTLDTPTLASR